jgi:hypothetical protein
VTSLCKHAKLSALAIVLKTNIYKNTQKDTVSSQAKTPEKTVAHIRPQKNDEHALSCCCHKRRQE